MQLPLSAVCPPSAVVDSAGWNFSMFTPDSVVESRCSIEVRCDDADGICCCCVSSSGDPPQAALVDEITYRASLTIPASAKKRQEGDSSRDRLFRNPHTPFGVWSICCMYQPVIVSIRVPASRILTQSFHTACGPDRSAYLSAARAVREGLYTARRSVRTVDVGTLRPDPLRHTTIYPGQT